MHKTTDEFTQRMLSAINSMMHDKLAAVARKDYEDRQRRQSEGIVKAKKSGKYKGRKVNHGLHENISALLKTGKSYNAIVELLKCSKSTISKIARSKLNDLS
jgi:DNA invertase Pin-like site-specific DNA recombinase